jgi:predicted unusual protein kinase regulating ubiquinone biosynthesis (AarF/ABC1/UbiB family)
VRGCIANYLAKINESNVAIMANVQWKQVQRILKEALAVPSEDRNRVIDELCEHDVSLREEVLSIIKHDQIAPPGFMRTMASPAHGSRDDVVALPDPLLGNQISRYQIESLIATGGMGSVYKARQDNPERPVALKIMKPGLNSRYVLRHFEFESQILARLRHPNIAQVYEAGVAEGDLPPYVVPVSNS